MPAFTFESAIGHFSMNHSFGALLAALISAYKSEVKRAKRNRALAALAVLNDATLSDVGIMRADFDRVYA